MTDLKLNGGPLPAYVRVIVRGLPALAAIGLVALALAVPEHASAATSGTPLDDLTAKASSGGTAFVRIAQIGGIVGCAAAILMVFFNKINKFWLLACIGGLFAFGALPKFMTWMNAGTDLSSSYFSGLGGASAGAEMPDDARVRLSLDAARAAAIQAGRAEVR